jgi:transposase-like protein
VRRGREISTDVQLWLRARQKVVFFFAFLSDVRRHLPTNILESLHMSSARSLRPATAFLGYEAATKRNVCQKSFGASAEDVQRVRQIDELHVVLFTGVRMLRDLLVPGARFVS